MSARSRATLPAVVHALFALLVLTGCSIEADDSGRMNVSFGQRAEESFQWKGQLAPGREIEIKGVNGAIRAEGTSDNQVEVEALKSGRRDDPAQVRIETVQHAGGVTICAVYPDSRFGEPNECVPGRGGRLGARNNDVRVEFIVRVPAGVDFVGRTVNGEVVADGLSGRVLLHTVNGSAHLATSAFGEASTVNGSITATLGRADWPGTLEFKTVNGGITVDFSGNLDADLEAQTVNGRISTDFPLTMQGTISRRSLHGRIGNGGRDLRLSSVNGSIRIGRRS